MHAILHTLRRIFGIRRIKGLVLAGCMMGVTASCAPIETELLIPARTTLSTSPLYKAQHPWSGPLLGDGTARALPQVIGAVELTSTDPRVGGLSGLTIAPDGTATFISDRGYWLRLPLPGQQDRFPSAIPDWSIDFLHQEQGLPLSGSKELDAEEVTSTPNGGQIVSFERHHRLAYYPPLENGRPPLAGNAHLLPPPPGLQEAPYNGGIESLTVLPDGRLIALLEGDQGGDHTTGWLATPQGPWSDSVPPLVWSSFSLALDHDFVPTSLAVLGDAPETMTAIILERSFHLTSGFAARLTRVPLRDLLNATPKTPPIRSEVIAWLTQDPVQDNWEGLTRDPRNPHTLWMVTDNNYLSLQRTMILTVDCSLCLIVSP
ncbi:esterase-like activity of phytase family protein [Insolitispirillum peregrinum]|uniref:Phytase-like domain-containing protein n=1 Tax=Insolitispirillum peregrinum TaxID=80876 RepID=A0A1N7NNL1_9PROT|nr:esterase-like activity of phytase family protein [Insolitispirillum peregrinum]SIS99902.1 hypothetical protein SAMN05421779_105257 [Insolitispirillum peregrinum]